MITYTEYPLLLFTSYNKGNAPEELPFEMTSEEQKQEVSNSKGFENILSLIAVKNTLKGENTTTNYYLSDTSFETIEHDVSKRNLYFQYFFSNYIVPKHGCIMAKNGGTYVYLLLGVNETRDLLKKDGRYLAVALFFGDTFLGFEEAIITKKGLEVMKSGIYSGGMDIGGYLSFCIITLAFSEGKTDILNAPNVLEKIIKL